MYLLPLFSVYKLKFQLLVPFYTIHHQIHGHGMCISCHLMKNVDDWVLEKHALRQSTVQFKDPRTTGLKYSRHISNTM